MTGPGKAVVAIGIFDGVHRGHQRILARAREVANSRSLPVLALTFHPHPTAILAPDRQPALLLNIHSRVELLKSMALMMSRSSPSAKNLHRYRRTHLSKIS